MLEKHLKTKMRYSLHNWWKKDTEKSGRFDNTDMGVGRKGKDE